MAVFLQLRKDLEFHPRPGNPSNQWVVKDPIGFNHFLLSEEDCFLLKLFDGSRGLEQVRDRWQDEFQTKSLSRDQLKRTVHRLLADNLLTTGQFGSGRTFRRQREVATKRRFWATVASPYAFRLGSINPKGILDLLNPIANLLFHPIVVIANFVLAAIVFLFFVGHFENVAQRAHLMTDFFSYENVAAILVVVAIVKVLHELGHALACQKFGGDCFEIGILVIVFFPTLYCDVSDSWTFNEKWKRILVSAAGLYVEIILASLASVCWLATSPGFANTIFFNIAIMCSVNSLLINGNPLLKYDGYYVASDLFNQPNLRARSQQQLAQLTRSMTLQGSEPASISVSLCLYGILSWLYRAFVFLSIFLGMYFLLEFAEFGKLAGAIVLGLAALAVIRMIGPWTNRKSLLNGSGGRLRHSFWICATTILVALCFVPLPSYVFCSFVVEPSGSSIVYAKRDGILHVHVGSFEHVTKGQLLAEVSDPRLTEEIQAKTKEESHLKRRLELASKLQAELAQAAIGVEQLRNQLSKTAMQLQTLRREDADLKLTAKLDGVVKAIPLEGRQLGKLTKTNRLLKDTVFDARNRNLPVFRGQPLFAIEQTKDGRLIAYLDEDSVEHLEIGQITALEFDRHPGGKIEGTIEQIVETDFLPLEMANPGGSDLPTADLPNQSKYRIVIQAAQIPDDVYTGSNGRARISVKSKTAFQKFYAAIQRSWR